ncbi:MAG: hypothetical protein LBB88_02715 [Planctomycetaceae bacterium]|jgi:hypothetical protein|nr:hypothetical protein [Planctomycetaceae bacterium]
MTQTEQSQNFDDNLKQRKRQIFYFRLVLIFVLLMSLTLIYIICFYSPPFVISPATTRITSPLTPDGQVDFFRYAEEKYNNDPRIKTDDNGFRIFVRTFGNVFDSARADSYYTEQKYEKLGLDFNIPPTTSMPMSPTTITSKNYSDKILSRAWMPEEFPDTPELSDWIKSVDETLDLITEMIRKPIFVCPLISVSKPSKNNPVNLWSLYSSELNDCREISRLYTARANYRIAKGDIDGAIDDTITIYQLGRHLAKEHRFMYSIVAALLERDAHSIPLNSNPNCPLTKEQIQRLRNTIDQFPPSVNSSEIYEFERLVVLDSVQFMLRDLRAMKNIDSVNYKFYYTFLLFPYDKNMVFIRVNEAYDVAIGKKSGSFRDYSTWSDTNKTFVKHSLTSYGRGIIIADYLISQSIPAASFAKDVLNCNECAINMKHLTLALLLYKSEHGEFPKDNWVEKIKPYLGDDFARHLHCPACLNKEKDKTNYALVMYDKLPKNQNVMQLIELRDPVPFAQATITAEETLREFKLEKRDIKIFGHPAGINVALQDGTVRFLSDSDYRREPDDYKKFQQLLDQEPTE